MHWEKSVPSNLFRMAEILVDRSEDKQVWLWSHCQNTFQVIIAFGHSTFIVSQSLCVPTNMVLKRYLACRTFNKMSAIRQWELFIHTYIQL